MSRPRPNEIRAEREAHERAIEQYRYDPFDPHKNSPKRTIIEDTPVKKRDDTLDDYHKHHCRVCGRYCPSSVSPRGTCDFC